ncbi:MAG: MFS transporter [Elusimicrobia bacterium]|nr:MFS transporter [Elusimicrobiota bacterium]
MEAWRELSGLPRRSWVLAAATLINRMGTMAVPFLSLYLIRSLGFSPAAAGWVLALYGATALVAAPLAGRLADRWGTSRLMRLSLVGSGLSMLAFPWAASFAAIAAVTVALAATTEGFRPAGMAAVAESSPAHLRKQAYALHRLAVNLGMSVGPALGGFLAGVSFPMIWFVDSASTFAAALVLWRWLPPARARSAPEPDAVPSARALSDGRLRYFLLALLPVALVFFQHESSFSIYLVRDLKLSESFYGLLFTVNTVMIVLLEVPINHATARWPVRRCLALGAALFAAGFGAYGIVSAPWQVIAATAVWTFGEMVLFPSMSAYVGDIAPVDRRGEYMGLYMMAFSLAFTAGAWGGLITYSRLGPGALWLLAFVAAGVSAAFFWRVPEPERRAEA